MSLNLNQDTKDNVVLSINFTNDAGMYINDNYIGEKDMCSLVKYFLTNKNLHEDDPRLALVESIKGAKQVVGWGNDGFRIDLSTPRQSPKAMIAEGLELLKINSCKLPEELTLKISNLISETYSDISIDEYDVNEVLVALCYVCKPEQEG